MNVRNNVLKCVIDAKREKEITVKVNIYNATEDLVNNLNNVEKIVACNDGRYLITTADKCKCCNQDVRLATQVPVNYKIEIKPESGDNVIINNL